jgi:hypothetical protein
VGLALFVFSWGLGYKLSLYDPPQSSSHQMPHAKLLSRDEQSTAVETSLASRAKSSDKIMHALLASAFFCFFLNLIPRNAPASYREAQEPKHTWRLRHRAGLSFFFVLPPPVLA